MVATFVLVHGSFCNSGVWARVAGELALRGHRTVAVDLPGHGLGATVPLAYRCPQDVDGLAAAPSGMAGISTSDDIALVSDVVRRASSLGPVVLVGHSRGGLTVTAVANRLPELISRAVYVSAWCPAGRTVSEYQELPELAEGLLTEVAAIAVGDPGRLGALRLNWLTGDPIHLDAIQRLLLADGNREELLGYLQFHQPDEALRIDETATKVDPETWGRVPHSYVRLTEDLALPLTVQDRLIKDADELCPDNPFDVHSLASSHIGFQLRPTRIVDILDALPTS
ncbi:alpha/beta hydrolase [Pseudonocardia spinosispora]|uniref:alpha/beta hydrolase n=1 Tax=Pseudonocardia spinosispora TaxID=103441 RepID=UPI00048E814A|nr:alpha/beta fold hydrolase [Pseudonocardia spinosispora]